MQIREDNGSGRRRRSIANIPPNALYSSFDAFRSSTGIEAAPTPETLHMVEFIRRCERGICRERRRHVPADL